ncbi:hypothetical protein ACFL1H_02645 [Nanoarchaeota archaeon]
MKEKVYLLFRENIVSDYFVPNKLKISIGLGLEKHTYFAANTLEEALASALEIFPEYSEEDFVQVERDGIIEEYEWCAKYVEKHIEKAYMLSENFERHALISDYFPEAYWKIDLEKGDTMDIKLNENICGYSPSYNNVALCLNDWGLEIKKMELVLDGN